MLRREAAQPEEARALAMFAGGVVVAGVLATGMATQGQLPWPPAPTVPWVGLALGMGVVFLLSNLTLQYGATRLPANVTSVVMLSEVLFAAVSAVALGRRGVERTAVDRRRADRAGRAAGHGAALRSCRPAHRRGPVRQRGKAGSRRRSMATNSGMNSGLLRQASAPTSMARTWSLALG